MESIAGLYSKPVQGERSTVLSFHWDPVAMEWNLWRPFFHWLTAQNNIQQIPLTTKQSFNSHLNTMAILLIKSQLKCLKSSSLAVLHFLNLEYFLFEQCQNEYPTKYWVLDFPCLVVSSICSSVTTTRTIM